MDRTALPPLRTRHERLGASCAATARERKRLWDRQKTAGQRVEWRRPRRVLDTLNRGLTKPFCLEQKGVAMPDRSPRTIVQIMDEYASLRSLSREYGDELFGCADLLAEVLVLACEPPADLAAAIIELIVPAADEPSDG